MKQRILSIGFILLGSLELFAQNPNLILAPKYSINGQDPIPLPIPSGAMGNSGTPQTHPGNPWLYALDGYDGQKATGAQNIILDNEGKIMFFVVNEGVYDRKGRSLGFMNNPNINPGAFGKSFVEGTIGELAIVPVPNECNSYYLLSSIDPSGQTQYGFPYYSKVIINYDNNDNPLPGSGLVPFDQDIEYYTAKSIADLAGPVFYNNLPAGHSERPLFAVSPEKNNFRYLFYSNGHKMLRYKIFNDDIVYDNYNLSLNSISPNIEINPAFTRNRQEMEVVELANGNYRMAIPLEYRNTQSFTNYSAVFVFDLSPSGVYIPNSTKVAQYEDLTVLTSLEVLISGIEFSPNGEKLYVTHNKIGQFQNAFDYFNLDSPFPARNIINVVGADDFALSQIESMPDSSIILPANTRLAKITNANNPNFTVDYDYSFLPLTNYEAVSVFPSFDEVNKVRILQDNIDGMDYSYIQNVNYDHSVYNANQSSDVLWEPNVFGTTQNNPLTTANNLTNPNDYQIIYIKEELRIPAGKNVTIKNMIFKFAPGAKVVVENAGGNSNGGKLTLDKTTFTVDPRCGDDMWLGVEVWGQGAVAQGTTSSSKHGVLVMHNNSKIEHAYIGALAGKRNPSVVPTPNYETPYLIQLYNYLIVANSGGGIIDARNSTFYQNQISLFLVPYSSSQSNKSIFRTCTFEWKDELLNNQAPYLFHSLLRDVRGVSFLGNNFLNTSTNNSHLLKGRGLQAMNSSFRVAALCLNNQCSQFTRNKFENLSQGIFVENTNSQTFEVDRSDFINCIIGSNVRWAKNERITRNNFYNHESSTIRTIGLFLNASTGYTVTENNFSNNSGLAPNPSILSYGIVVRNSGTLQNEIYKNTFWNLKIGGQAEGENAILITETLNDTGDDPLTPGVYDPTMRGLKWKCNVFNSAITSHDLVVKDGRINAQQGVSGSGSTAIALKASANNKFSITSENEPIAHDIYLENSQKLTYYHISTPSYIPLARSSNVNLSENTGTNLASVNYSASACPSLLSTIIFEPRTPVFVGRIEGLLLENKELREKIDGGNTNLLKEFITNNNPGAVHSKLVQLSPYLSDEILIHYMNQNPNTNHLKQILIANSKLSKEVSDKLNTISMPNGTKNQILNEQTKINQRDLLADEIKENNRQIDLLENQLHHELQMDSLSLDSLIVELEKSPKIRHKQTLLDISIQKGDLTLEQNTKNALIASGSNQEFMNVMEIQKKIKEANSELAALEMYPELLAELQVVSTQDIDVSARENALITLGRISSQMNLDQPLTLIYPKNLNNESENAIIHSAIKFQYITIYPNPSTGKVNLDFQQIPDGKMDIQIVDLTGKIVYENSFENTNGELIDLSEVHKGLFLIKVLIDKQVVEVQKLELK
jgi:hypothetical protein